MHMIQEVEIRALSALRGLLIHPRWNVLLASSSTLPACFDGTPRKACTAASWRARVAGVVEEGCETG